MDARRTTLWLLPLAVLSLPLMMPTRAGAQNNNDQRRESSQATIQVQFRSTPVWRGVSGTHVEEIAGPERPAFDMFRYNANYYAYRGHRWYTSNRATGQFTVVDDAAVPGEFARVPADHWRDYPTAWQNGQDSGFDDAPSTIQVEYIRTPSWGIVRGTRIWAVRPSAQLDYDLFRVGGTYYAFDNDQWYSSRRRSGVFTTIDDRYVPMSDLSRIPPERWRNYPSAWLDGNGNPRRHDMHDDRFDRRDQRSADQGDRH